MTAGDIVLIVAAVTFVAVVLGLSYRRGRLRMQVRDEGQAHVDAEGETTAAAREASGPRREP